MNMNQIINMVIRMIMRRAINSGISAGINAASGSGRKSQSNRDQDGSQPVSDGPRARRQTNAQGVPGQAKQISRITRRLMRF